MAKKNDKQSMAEDYIAQVEWESSHPLDKRGRPSWKYQPNWKYKKVYPHIGKIPVIAWIIIAAAVIPLGFIVFITSIDYPGGGIVATIALLSVLAILLFLARKPR